MREQLITGALAPFEVCSSELLEARALQKRVDSKYMFSLHKLPALLETLSESFHIVLSDGKHSATYETLYYDTPDRALFDAHRRGRRPRHKVRVRHYAERNLCFLETKTKDRYSVTTKHRYTRDARAFDLNDADRVQVIDAIGDVGELVPAVWLDFRRVTLVGVNHLERMTFDLGVSMRADDKEAAFPDVCIAELKQARFASQSPGVQALRAFGIRPGSMSKYCIAASTLLFPGRTTPFRATARELERLSHA
ncbi:MAG: hypothetical protein ACI81R_002970 [Bradymonadia bacterium]